MEYVRYINNEPYVDWQPGEVAIACLGTIIPECKNNLRTSIGHHHNSQFIIPNLEICREIRR